MRIIFNASRTWHKLLVSGFLISQAILNRCIVTMIENSVRYSHGYSKTSNEFILHNLVGNNTGIYRLIFLVIGVFILGTVIGETLVKLETKRATKKIL